MILTRLIFFLFIVISAFHITAQNKAAPTSKTDITFQAEVSRKGHPTKKKMMYIFKNKGKGLLYGNPCMNRETRQMGFEYVVQVQGMPGSLLTWRRIWENTKVSLRLSMRYTPFWKVKLNKRVKDCRQKSGDFVG